ncbi:MAG: hypothetical protein A3H57_01260 [Candidatus Taylorbacteria bacterium RIFCSPLOWO2_02_FULL_43_11]|uniref:Acylneuraminate cytidylyltransferase n=1 Tax=Candidatus Taylorbacteria bacterium RIFCSPHIGHO2_02_FULL_43_32b TaxID=1802306 RepID=A0A1G2MKY6_9BACT|nr:MAG: hypothetical protein A3C72_01680 [Candidatus Taylorbacteria bacterium RIFCSPHIGHO2_02_FULL_43_32b]OHA35807.1 MAG: hypothetical protein A3H57_01260 [Candidatus Taylorbacteria bacterium RIFCSPLOWO2_02_FULL_43_11]
MSKKKKTVAIIQARMGSSRLPGKMMMDIEGRPLIAHVVERAKRIPSLDSVWLATTISERDEPLAQYAKTLGIEIYRGSEDDVLDRYYEAAKLAKADIVMRITGDCPLLDPEVSDLVMKGYLNGDVDYVTNTKPPTFPDGLDTEVFSFEVLARVCKEAELVSEREHVTPYIWKNPKLFTIRNILQDIDLSGERWTIDTKEDFEFVSQVLRSLGTDKSDMMSIYRLLLRNPELRKINKIYKRDEGYAKSLKEDKKYEDNQKN